MAEMMGGPSMRGAMAPMHEDEMQDQATEQDMEMAEKLDELISLMDELGISEETQKLVMDEAAGGSDEESFGA